MEGNSSLNKVSFDILDHISHTVQDCRVSGPNCTWALVQSVLLQVSYLKCNAWLDVLNA